MINIIINRLIITTKTYSSKRTSRSRTTIKIINYIKLIRNR